MLESKALLVTLGGHLVEGASEERKEHVVMKIERNAVTTPTGTASVDGGAIDAGANGEGDGRGPVAVTGSAEIAPPMFTAPMKIASREAPMITPVLTSPIRRPATRPTTRGRSIMH